VRNPLTFHSYLGIARQSNACGRAVGFYMGPALVSAASDLPTLLYVEVAMAVAVLLGFLVYFPEGPKHAPTRSAQLLAATAEVEQSHSIGTICREAWKLCQLKSRVFLLVLSFGLQVRPNTHSKAERPCVAESNCRYLCCPHAHD